MGDTFIDATQSYENETSSTAITEVSNDDLLSIPTTSDPSNLIRLVNNPTTNTNNLYLLQANTAGEIRFLTKDAYLNNDVSANEGNLYYNAKIGADGKLYLYWTYNVVSNPIYFSGWKDIMNDVAESFRDINLLEAAVFILEGQLTSLTTNVAALDGIVSGHTGLISGHTTQIGIIDLALADLTTIVVNMASMKSFTHQGWSGWKRRTNVKDAWSRMSDRYNFTPSSSSATGITTAGELFSLGGNTGAETATIAGLVSRTAAEGGSAVNVALGAGKKFLDGLGYAFLGAGIVGGITAVAYTYDKQGAQNDEIALPFLYDVRAGLYNDSLKSAGDPTKKTILPYQIHKNGLTISAGTNNGFTTAGLYEYEGNISYPEMSINILITAGLVAEIASVVNSGVKVWTVGDTILIPKASIGGTSGSLTITVNTIYTATQIVDLHIAEAQARIDNRDKKMKRRSNVVNYDDIDTNKLTYSTATQAYTDYWDTQETLTYKKLTSRLNLLPTGTSDIDVYTSTGKIGIGTTPTKTLHTYHATDNILRLGTATNGTASIEFVKGTDLDVNTDWRLKLDNVMKLQYQNSTLAFGDTGTDLMWNSTTQTTFFKPVEFQSKVGIGTGVPTTHFLDVFGDINIKSGAKYKINNTDLALTDLTGTLAVDKGGTGASSFTANGLIVGNGTTALTQPTGLTFSGTTLNAPIMNVASGGKYKINNTDLSYNDLTDKLTAGTNITISATNQISASGGGATYTAGDGIAISGTNAISLGGTFNNFYMYPTLQTALLPADLVFTGTQPVVFSLPSPFNTLNKCVILGWDGVGTSTNYSFVIPTGGLIIDFLMVGSGGCGGKDMGAGGGGGATMFGTNLYIPAGSYSANVGRGAQSSLNEAKGRDTSCFNAGCAGGGSAPNVAYNGYSYSNQGGGGAGGTSVANGNNYSAVGGEGGIDSVFGGSYRGNTLTKCTLNQGLAGGTGVNTRAGGGTGQICSAGGGSGNNYGVNGASTTAIGTGTAPSNGGAGVLNDILGTGYRWGGGGGGGSTGYLNASTGGAGGGGGGQNANGAGATSYGAVGGTTYYTGGTGTTALNGVNGTGGGGGGVGLGTTLAGNGGSGVVIIRYRRPKNAQIYIENAIGATPVLRTFRTGMVDGNFKIQSVVASTGVSTDVISVEEATGDLSIGSYTGGIAVSASGTAYFKNDITSAGIVVKNGSITCDNNIYLSGAYGYGNLRITGLISNNIENKAVWTTNALSPTGGWQIKLASMPQNWYLNIHNLVVWDMGNVSGLSSNYFGVWGFTNTYPYEGLLLSSNNKVNNAQTIAVSYGVVSSVGYFVITGIPITTQVFWRLT